jgi:hypothetical protein
MLKTLFVQKVTEPKKCAHYTGNYIAPPPYIETDTRVKSLVKISSNYMKNRTNFDVSREGLLSESPFTQNVGVCFIFQVVFIQVVFSTYLHWHPTFNDLTH